MATAVKQKSSSVSILHKKAKKKRPNKHKKKISSLKTSKKYKKLYNSQGK